MSDELTLALDGSSEKLHLALLDRKKCRAGLTLALDEPHSRTMMPAIEKLLGLAGVGIDEISSLFVNRGPGSFSSLRISLAAMQGLSQGLGCPLYTFIGLDLLAAGFAFWPGRVAVLTDARRSQVYWALYRFEEGLPVRETACRVADPEAVAESLAGTANLLLAGAGVDLYRAALTRKLPLAGLAGALYSRPQFAGLLAFPRVENAGGETDGPGPVVLERAGKQAAPFYIRPSDAELNRQNRK